MRRKPMCVRWDPMARIMTATLGLVLFLGTIERVHGSLYCKYMLREIIMKQCSGDGGRYKRGLEKFDLQKEDYRRLKNSDDDRDVISYNFASSIRSTFKKLKLPFDDVLDVEILELFEGKPVDLTILDPDSEESPYDSIRLNKRSLFERPSESQDAFGLGFNVDDLEELYDEVYGRSARNSENSEEQKRSFINEAAKCCRDLQACEKNPKLIPCP